MSTEPFYSLVWAKWLDGGEGLRGRGKIPRRKKSPRRGKKGERGGGCWKRQGEEYRNDGRIGTAKGNEREW